MHVAGLAADKGFINFDLAAQLPCRTVLQSQTTAMHHEPCGLLGDAKCTGDLIGTNSILAVNQHPDCGKPFVQSNCRVLKDSPDFDRELAVMVHALALPLSLVRKEWNIGSPANRTDNAVRPAPSGKIIQTIVRLSEIQNCLLQGLWFAAHGVPHKQNYTKAHLICQVYSCPYKSRSQKSEVWSR